MFLIKNKMKIHILFTIIILHYSMADRNEMPVLITDDGNVLRDYDIPQNPFIKITNAYFADVVLEVLKSRSPLIIFVEDTLSTEDITSKDVLGSPFTYLNTHLRSDHMKYLPSVTQALQVITQVFPPHTSNVFYLHSADKFDLSSNFRYIYVRFIENPSYINKTRVAKLRDHDLLMEEIYLRAKQVRVGPPIVTFYTGKFNPITIEKLKYSYSRGADSDERIVMTDNALFRLAGVYSESPVRARLVRYTHVPSVAAEQMDYLRSVSTTVSYSDFELMFNFHFQDDGWILDDVVLLESDEEVGRTSMGVGAPWEYSFVCAEPITIINTRDSSSVTISKYQIEVTRYPGRTRRSFGGPVNCGPFFNSQILAALFVVALLLIILFSGLVVLMNCHSNDRYDNPHGKEVITKADL